MTSNGDGNAVDDRTDAETGIGTNGGTDDRMHDGMDSVPDDSLPSVTPFSEMDEEERRQLLRMLSNPAWWDDRDRAMTHATETVSFLAAVTCDGHLADCVPAVRRLGGRLEPIPMSRIRGLMFDMYDVDEQTREDCKRIAEERLRASKEQDERRRQEREAKRDGRQD